MKTVLFAILLIGCTAVTAARGWSFNGDFYAGGGGRFSTYQGLDGEDANETSTFGEGALTLMYNNGFWYGSIFAEALRDEYYTEITGKASLAIADNAIGNYRFYMSYRNLDDITDLDNDSGTLSFYLEGMKYLNRDVSVNVFSHYSSTAYKHMMSMTPDYSNLMTSAALNYKDISVRLSTEKVSYAEGSLIPDSLDMKAQVYLNYYRNSILSYSSLSYQTKDYDFSDLTYRPYTRLDINTRTGYRLSSTFIPYLLGSYVKQNEEAVEYEESLTNFSLDGSYTLWKIGAEINAFKYPMTLSAKIGRQEFDQENFEKLAYRNHNILSLQAGWSYWGEGHSITISDKWEQQTYDRTYFTEYYIWYDAFDAVVNNALLIAEYDLANNVSTEFRLGMDSYDYSQEDYLHYNYKQYLIGFTSDYHFSSNYTLSVITEYITTAYESVPENDIHDITVKSFLKMSF